MPISRTQIKKRLSILKATVSETRSSIGLVEDKSKARALNENRYFCSEWSYTRQYDSVVGLRPHLQIELTARSPVLSGALRQASADTTIQAEYTKNLIPLIYGNETPEFGEAFNSFNAVAVSLLATLQNQ